MSLRLTFNCTHFINIYSLINSITNYISIFMKPEIKKKSYNVRKKITRTQDDVQSRKTIKNTHTLGVEADQHLHSALL